MMISLFGLAWFIWFWHLLEWWPDLFVVSRMLASSVTLFIFARSGVV